MHTEHIQELDETETKDFNFEAHLYLKWMKCNQLFKLLKAVSSRQKS